jgi:hypothetical protein
MEPFARGDKHNLRKPVPLMLSENLLWALSLSNCRTGEGV